MTRRAAVLAAAAAVLSLLGGMVTPAVAQTVLPDYFWFVADCQTTSVQYALFSFPTVATPDLQPRTDGVYGSGRWNRTSGARPQYEWGYAFWDHEDPGHHGFIPAIRLFINPIGHRSECTTRINSAYFNQNGGLPPYPYERWNVARPVNLSHPGGTIRIFHHRPNEPNKANHLQLLAELSIPAISPQNANVRWWYQGNGIWIGEDRGLPILQIILSGVNSSYMFCVEGIPPCNDLRPARSP